MIVWKPQGVHTALDINGNQYVYADYREIKPYNEIYKLICCSTDGEVDFYEAAMLKRK